MILREYLGAPVPNSLGSGALSAYTTRGFNRGLH